MKFEDKDIKKILLDENYVTKDDIKKAEFYAEEHRCSFLEYLLSQNLITGDIIGQAIAESLQVAYSDLHLHSPAKEQVLLIPEEIAQKYRIILFKQNKSSVVVTTDNPKTEGLNDALSLVFPNKKIDITFSLSEDIDNCLSYYLQKLETRFAKIIAEKGKIAPEIVDQIIDDALLVKASDIHIEPQEHDADVRFRIDGVLHDAGKIPWEYFENIINRLKIQAKLRIDEHFSSQDGAIRYFSKSIDIPVDLRVSVVPTLNGEKIAIRILSSYVRDLTLSDIGLSDELQKQIMISSRKPFGMILVTGPTGSGKTTTLYSLIKQHNTRQINITTIEDPVEYKVEGINQIQVNSQTNLTFSQGLRAIARQDPNIILVGEIRDLETADIAVNAALTGHLLLSTFHANNAATAIPRFIDMGVEPFLVSSTLELVISQRLARRICDSCKVSYNPSKAELAKYDAEVIKYFDLGSQILYKGKGCNVCAGTGFKGRIGLFEFITVTPDLQDLISKHPSTKDVLELIRAQGFKSMFEDGIRKVKLGVTSIDELLRVVAP